MHTRISKVTVEHIIYSTKTFISRVPIQYKGLLLYHTITETLSN